MAGLCSTVTPATLFDCLSPDQRSDRASRDRFLQGHLPQGAPTSPALANLCARQLDCRLDGRVTWVENVNPHRGLKLRLLFMRIGWG